METIRSISSISAFEKVAKHSSFSKAAIELGASKAYISKLIQSLEEDFGEKLFNRSTRKVKLTIVGEGLYQQCIEPLAEIDRIRKNMLTSNRAPRGIFRISVAGSFGEEIIAPVVFKLLKKYSELKVELSFSTKNVDLLDESFDIAIRVGELSDSSLITRKIATRKEYICASKKYLRINGTPKSPEELKDHNCLAGATQSWVFLEKKKSTRLKISGPFKSANGRTLLRGALNDVGIVKLPDIYVSKYLQSGELVSILDSYTPKEIPIWAVSYAKKTNSINIKTFLELLEEEIKLTTKN